MGLGKSNFFGGFLEPPNIIIEDENNDDQERVLGMERATAADDEDNYRSVPLEIEYLKNNIDELRALYYGVIAGYEYHMTKKQAEVLSENKEKIVNILLFNDAEYQVVSLDVSSEEIIQALE